MRSRGRTEKSQNGQKHHRTKAQKDKNQSRQNIQKRKYFNTPTMNLYDSMIHLWTINILIMRSRMQTEKSQNGQKHHRTIAPKDKNQSGQNPQKRKYFNTPTIKVYNHMITWYRCGQSKFSSCDHVGGQRKAKMDKKHHRTNVTNYKNQSGQNNQKKKYFNTPTIKVYGQMITWYRCLQSIFSSCDHVCGQRKPKWTKAP